LITIFCFSKVSIVLIPLFPPLPYRCGGVGTRRKMSKLLTIENLYDSAANAPGPRISVLLTKPEFDCRPRCVIKNCS